MNHLASQSEVLSRSSILVIDIGGTHIKFGFVAAGEPLAFSHLVPTARLRNAHPVDSLARETQEAIGMHGTVPDVVVCTVPGFLAGDGDLVLHLTNLPEMDGHRLRTELSVLLGCPVMLERDSNLALLGESVAGVASDVGPVLGIFFGTGIGASMIIDGKLFRGNGWALELGHAPFFGEGREGDGLKHPSIEDYASGRALQAIAVRHDVPIAKVFVAAERNPELSAALDRFVRYQALAVSSAAVVLSPKIVVLGGGVVEIEAYPKRRLEALIAANTPFEKLGHAMDLRWARLGWVSTLHGAPRIVREYDAGRLAA
jgi:predicted NBD/HSP70 family sugar kinase